MRVLVAIVLMSVFGRSRSQCGQRLGKGALICEFVRAEKDTTLDLDMCTHVVIYSNFGCSSGTCSPEPHEEIDDTIRWLQPELRPVGLKLLFDPDEEEYLKTRIQRYNSAQAIIEYMTKRKLTFILFAEQSWKESFKKEGVRNFVTLIEEMSDFVHDRNWHLGLALGVRYDSTDANYDYVQLSERVDWFSFLLTKEPYYREYLGAYRPLFAEPGETGSMKYWIDLILPWLKPECILLEMTTHVLSYKAADIVVEPGIGSKLLPGTHPVVKTDKEMCEVIIDGTCPEYWDELSNTPWTVCGRQFFSYDNAESFRRKVDFALSYNLSGVVLWTKITVPNCDIQPNIIIRAIQGIRRDTTRPGMGTNASTTNAFTQTRPYFPERGTEQATLLGNVNVNANSALITRT